MQLKKSWHSHAPDVDKVSLNVKSGSRIHIERGSATLTRILAAISNKLGVIQLLLVLIYLINSAGIGNPPAVKAQLRGLDTWSINLLLSNFLWQNVPGVLERCENKASSRQHSKDWTSISGSSRLGQRCSRDWQTLAQASRNKPLFLMEETLTKSLSFQSCPAAIDDVFNSKLNVIGAVGLGIAVIMVSSQMI